MYSAPLHTQMVASIIIKIILTASKNKELKNDKFTSCA